MRLLISVYLITVAVEGANSVGDDNANAYVDYGAGVEHQLPVAFEKARQLNI